MLQFFLFVCLFFLKTYRQYDYWKKYLEDYEIRPPPLNYIKNKFTD